MKVLDCKNKNYISKLYLILEKRRSGKKINTNVVSKIINDVKNNKFKALLKYEKRFSKNKEIELSNQKISKAIKSLDQKTKEAIDFAYNRILKFHSKQQFKNIKFRDNLNNKLEYKIVPIESVGIYVPANLPSTLLMNAFLQKLQMLRE